jgi:hypothetical protein
MEMPNMKTGLQWAAKAAAMAVVLALGSIITGILLRPPGLPPTPDGPLSAMQALLVVSLVEGMLLSCLAMRMNLRGWALGATLAAVLFGVETALSMIEAAFFNADLHLPLATLLMVTLSALLRDILAGIAVAYLWRGSASTPPTAYRGLPWKVPVITLIYVIAYFLAGALIAWQSPAVRAFYANVQQVSIGSLALLQIGRGLMWTGFVFLIVRHLQGSALQKALLSGVTLALLMALQLLYPNPVMPWPVRSVHIVEIGVSNLVFGMLAALILLGAHGRSRSAHPAAHLQAP